MNVKKFSSDFFYTCGAHAIINAIQHLFVFPWINKVSGPETAGRILACLSIVYIFSTTFGVGITSVRLVQDRKGTGKNGDYLCIMGIGSVLLIFVAILAKHFDFDPQVLAIPPNVTLIGDGAFANCSGLTGLTIPPSVETIPSGTFEGCSNLKHVTFPDSLKTIEDGAFFGCKSLDRETVERLNAVNPNARSQYRFLE